MKVFLGKVARWARPSGPRLFSKRKYKSHHVHRQALTGWVLVLPSVIVLGLFSIYPMVNAFYLSFFEKNLLSSGAAKFVGLKNYVFIFHSQSFLNSLIATGIFSLGSWFLLVSLSLFLAILISTRKRFQGFLQLAFFSPAIVSSVVSAVVWLLIFEPRGLANQLVNSLSGTIGVDYRWLVLPSRLRLATIIVYVWRYLGYFTVIFIAGIGAIPRSFYEAARVDGANAWHIFWHVTLPLLKPTTLFVSVVALIYCLRTFSIQYLFTQAGAPRAPIDVITLNIYYTAIRNFQIGRANAMSIVLFFIMLILSWLQFRFSRSEEVSYQ